MTSPYSNTKPYLVYPCGPDTSQSPWSPPSRGLLTSSPIWQVFFFFFSSLYFVPISNSPMSTRVISQGHTNSLKLFSRASGSCWTFSAFTITVTTSPTRPFPGHPSLSGLLCFLLFPDGGASMADHIIFMSMIQAMSFLWVVVWDAQLDTPSRSASQAPSVTLNCTAFWGSLGSRLLIKKNQLPLKSLCLHST